MSDKIYVAKLGRTLGLNGTVKIFIDSDFPEQFKKGTKLLTDRQQHLTIKSFNAKNDSIQFEEIATVEEAKKLTNRHLFVSMEQTKEQCALEENQYFWFDLMGCELYEDDENIGKVIDIQRLPLADYLLIETSQELIKQNYSKQFLIPYQETYIQKVLLTEKKIHVSNCKDILEAS
jgi:16S rRNA processing protein RimM